ncbi:MAG: hypothetical protein M3438_06095, partial [Pseudomonadota bacterium]|nr:hypothetical protein [Pseudomonadota bacterium]
MHAELHAPPELAHELLAAWNHHGKVSAGARDRCFGSCHRATVDCDRQPPMRCGGDHRPAVLYQPVKRGIVEHRRSVRDDLYVTAPPDLPIQSFRGTKTEYPFVAVAYYVQQSLAPSRTEQQDQARYTWQDSS